MRLRPREANLVERGQNVGTLPNTPVAVRRFPLVLIESQDERAHFEVRLSVEERARDNVSLGGNRNRSDQRNMSMGYIEPALRPVS